MKYYYVYILECADASYYLGVTSNPDQRLKEHELSIIGYVSNRKPFKLVYVEEFKEVKDAINFEKQVKGWRRAKKKALIDGNIKKLRKLSRSYGSSGSP